MCPISFNIHRMKLNEGHLSFGTVIIHFRDKPYHETNFKRHSNSVLLCIKILSELHMPCFILIFVRACFCNEIERCQSWKPIDILAFCDQWNMMSDLNMSREKMSDFVSCVLFGFPSVIKLRKFDFENH